MYLNEIIPVVSALTSIGMILFGSLRLKSYLRAYLL